MIRMTLLCYTHRV